MYLIKEDARGASKDAAERKVDRMGSVRIALQL